MTSDKTLAALSRAVNYCGTEASDPPSRRLCFGRIAVKFENDQLRDVRLGGAEVLRCIAFRVRDEKGLSARDCWREVLRVGVRTGRSVHTLDALRRPLGEAELKLGASTAGRVEAKNEQAPLKHRHKGGRLWRRKA